MPADRVAAHQRRQRGHRAGRRRPRGHGRERARVLPPPPRAGPARVAEQPAQPDRRPRRTGRARRRVGRGVLPARRPARGPGRRRRRGGGRLAHQGVRVPRPAPRLRAGRRRRAVRAGPARRGRSTASPSRALPELLAAADLPGGATRIGAAAERARRGAGEPRARVDRRRCALGARRGAGAPRRSSRPSGRGRARLRQLRAAPTTCGSRFPTTTAWSASTPPSDQGDGPVSAQAFRAVLFDIGDTLVRAAAARHAGRPARRRAARWRGRHARCAGARPPPRRGHRHRVMGEADVRSALGESGVAERLEVVITSRDVGVAKPDPRGIDAALDRLGGRARRVPVRR